MTKPNKALQATKTPQMVDITKLHTPSGYADLIGHSRANVYLLIKSGNIKPENVFTVSGSKMILEDGKEGERREKNNN